MKWWQARQNPPLPLIALGDSPNDLSLLVAADVAVVINSASPINPQGPATIGRTSLPGPAGMTNQTNDLLDSQQPLINSRRNHG